MSYLALKKIHVMMLLEMKFSKKLLEKTSMVMLRPLALGSKFLVQLLKGALQRKNELKEGKSSKSNKKVKRRLNVWRINLDMSPIW